MEIAAFKQLVFQDMYFFATFSEFACLKVLKIFVLYLICNGFILLQLLEKCGRFVQSFLKRVIETKSKRSATES